MTTVHSTADPAEIHAPVLDWLSARPAENNVLLGLVDRHRKIPERVSGTTYAWLTDDGSVVGVAIWMKPHIAMLSDMPDDGRAALVDHLRSLGGDLPGVNGPAETTGAFARHWGRSVGRPVRRSREQVMLRLDEVIIPPRPAGRPRPGQVEELDVLAGWTAAVVVRAGMDAASARTHVESQIRAGRIAVWHDGGPVAMCGSNPSVGSILRIGPVYCPPEHRGRGYASAITAQVCGEALRDGTTSCVVYSDSTNSAATELYRKIGFGTPRNIDEYRFEPSE